MAIGPLYRSFLEIARTRGVDVDAALSPIGLSEAMVVDPNTRLDPDQGRALGRAVVALLRDPEVGLRAAEGFRFSDMDVLGYMMRNAAHPLEALEQLARYPRLLGDTLAVRLERRDGFVTILIGLSDGRCMLPEAADGIVAGVLKFVAELSQGRALPIAVDIARPRPPRTEPYQQMFRCPVAFETTDNRLLYEEAALTVLVPERDGRLAALIEEQARRMVSELPPEGSIVERVQVHIARRLETGDGDLPDIAAALGMSERTLRRRLRDAGFGYRELLDRVRREFAVVLVEQGHAITAVAQRVGFADATAFARAFRRWTGVLPHEYRARR